MADFTLTVKTDSSAELLDIVSKIAGSMPLPQVQIHGGGVATERRMPTLDDFKQAERVVAGIESEMKAAVKEIGAADDAESRAARRNAFAEQVEAMRERREKDWSFQLETGRDAHGIKRDDRIHANAADPFKADGTWKRRKNVPDEQYEEIHLELVREARAAGLYTGPAIPELELEEQMGPFYWSHPESSSFGMVDTLAQLEEMLAADDHAVEIDEGQYLKLQAEDSAAAPAEVAQPAPVPAPSPVPAAPAPGMSAEATPTYQQAVVALFNAGGPTAPQVALQAMGLTIATQATPQQLRDMVTAAEMVTALGIAPADKPTKGPEHTREALAALGYVASDLGYVV